MISTSSVNGGTEQKHKEKMEVAVGLEPTKLVLQTSASSASASPPQKNLYPNLYPELYPNCLRNAYLPRLESP